MRTLEIDGVQVEDYGGKGNLRRYLRTLPTRTGFSDLRAVAITRDADADPDAAWQALTDAVSETLGREVPEPGAFSDGSPRVGALLLPGPSLPGALEDLCLATIGQHPALDCVERFLRCASEQGLVPADGQLGKARLQAWLAAQARPGRRLGEAARDGLWDLGAPALATLRGFLAELAR